MDTRRGSPRTVRRLVLLAVVALLSMACATTCAAPPWGPKATLVEIALYLQDGHPAALFRTCDGLGVTSIYVHEEAAGWSTLRPEASQPTSTDLSIVSTGPGPELRYHSWRADAGPGAQPVTSMELLVAPPGWVLFGGDAYSSPLTRFDAIHTYAVLTEPVSVVLVTFTLADLRGLADGQVWAMPTPTGPHEKAMTREDFQTAAAATCQSERPPPRSIDVTR